MKAICPVTKDNSLLPLIKMGVSEFYFGYIPSFWAKKYSLINSINRRYSCEEQIISESAVDKLLKYRKNNLIKIFIALNAPLYTTEQISRIVSMLRSLHRNGLSGAIVSDLGLLLAIRENIPNLDIHVSCGTVCLNSQSLKFFAALGVKRIVLSRCVDTSEIETIRSENKDIELEVIFTTKDCRNIDGFCTHLHSSDNTVACCGIEKSYLDKGIIRERNDSYLRLFYLFKMGVNYVKFPRRGETAEEFIETNGLAISLIKELSLLKPESAGEWKQFLVSKYKHGKSHTDR